MSAKNEVLHVDLDSVVADPEIQQRSAGIDAGAVEEYAAHLDELPPVTLYKDATGVFWLADGFHRFAAFGRTGRATIPAEVRRGSRRQAILHACRANATHGVRRTNADKRRAVMTLLGDPQWSQWSDRVVAERTGVHHSFVSRVRAQLSPGDSSDEAPRVGKDGKSRRPPRPPNKSAPPRPRELVALENENDKDTKAHPKHVAEAKTQRDPGADGNQISASFEAALDAIEDGGSACEPDSLPEPEFDRVASEPSLGNVLDPRSHHPYPEPAPAPTSPIDRARRWVGDGIGHLEAAIEDGQTLSAVDTELCGHVAILIRLLETWRDQLGGGIRPANRTKASKPKPSPEPEAIDEDVLGGLRIFSAE